MVDVDSANWSGEGTFTQVLLEHLRRLDGIAFIKVEDAPASRSDADYNFISNEIFVGFATESRREPAKRFGFFPTSREVVAKRLTMSGLEGVLKDASDVGEPDYADEGMLQYLRTERIVPPYQTRGYKLVELVRIYEAGTARRP